MTIMAVALRFSTPIGRVLSVYYQQRPRCHRVLLISFLFNHVNWDTRIE